MTRPPRRDDTEVRIMRDVARDVISEEIVSCHLATKMDIGQIREDIANVRLKINEDTKTLVNYCIGQHEMNSHKASLIPKPIYTKRQIVLGAGTMTSIVGFFTWLITYIWSK